MAAHETNFNSSLRQRKSTPNPVVIDGKQYQIQTTERDGRPGCSIRYLITLLLELKKARCHPLLCNSTISNEESQLRRLQFLASEISKLLDQPDLFPSPRTKAHFLAILGADAALQFSQACTALLLKRELRNLDRNSRKKLTRPLYKDGSSGWENFLFNGAPGSGHTAHRTIPKSIFQVVPAVAMRIIADWDREEANIVHFVDASTVRLDVAPAATTLMIDFDRPTPPDQYIPDVQMSQQSLANSIRPNPFRDDRKLRLDLVTPGPEPLEMFSPFIHRLEFPPPPMNAPPPVLNAPNAFPIITLRSWHPPTRLQDLRPLG